MVQTQDELFADNVKVFILRIHLISNAKGKAAVRSDGEDCAKRIAVAHRKLPLRL
jgi:hypothetical protein